MFFPGFSTPIVMGVINMSPNSFINAHLSLDAALASVEGMVLAGAEFVDIGGEATSPKVDLHKEKPKISDEIDRVAPVVEAIKKRFDVLISVDTSEIQVMKEVISLGADMINNQQVKKHPEAFSLIAQSNVYVCLMHFFTPLREPNFSDLPDLLAQIKKELNDYLKMARKANLPKEKIMLDPGFGGGVNYGKSTQENFYLLAHLNEFKKMGCPLLLGWSRKSMIGEALGNLPPEERLFGSIAAETILALNGAAIIRTHDVKAVCDMLKVVNAYKQASEL